MKSYGLLGEKLGHSYSPQIHKMLGGYDYSLIELEPSELGSFMRSGSFVGINVTIPYKKAVIPYCGELSETARLTGSVNTVIRRSDGSLYGDNTDCGGFDAMLDAMNIPIGKKALILGNGGVSPSVKAVLSARGVSEIITVSRSGGNNYVNLNKHYDAELIVNATPVGMYPHNYGSLIDLTCFDKCRGVVDLVYNPLRTRLVLDALSLGIPACGGLYMLVAQAAKACGLFTGCDISAERVNEVYITLKRQAENVILIGMPGCGKSTTLYSFLKELNDPTVNIVTVEDPVEYTMAGVNQTQVNTKANMTFAAALRSILRQDPDVIMIGEIRDEETAEIAVRAAITGHLVFSTLHTNDAPGAIIRLEDMGVQNYLVGDALGGVIAQRLVKRLCPACKKRGKTNAKEMEMLGIDEPVTISRPQGCQFCNNTGYKGRVAVHEIMYMNETMRNAVAAKTDLETLRRTAEQNGMRTLFESGKDLVLKGVTSLQELMSLSTE